jgi:flagellar hook-associated protein 2
MDISNVSTTPSIDVLVSQYMAIERQPVVKLETEKEDINDKKAIFTELKSKLTALKSEVNDLKQTGTLSKFGAKLVTTADEDIITASGNRDAVDGSHLIKVLQLAKADTVVTDRFTNTGTTIESTEGTGTKTFRVTINSVDTDVNVDISASETDSTILANIVTAINNSDAEAHASVVSDSSTTSKLVLRSDSTGSTYAISLSDVTGTLLSTIGLDDSVQATSTTGGYIYDDNELTSSFELDGISITNDSNTVEDVLTGVTLNLKGTQEAADDAVKISIAPDKETIKENLQAFFDDYNEVITYIKDQMAVDPDNNKRGPLTGDFTFINLRLNLRMNASNKITSVQSGNPEYISEVGIEPDSDGKLSIKDSDDFDDAIDASIDKVEDLFNSTSGIAVQIYDLVSPFTRTGGIIDDDTTILDERIKNINNRIDSLEKRLEWKEQNYRNQFIKLQEAFSSLGMQQQIMSVVNSSLSLSSRF